jgi:myosin heavy subunit
MNALKALDFSDSAVESIWKLVAVILHLGNLEFYADDKDHVSISQSPIIWI